MSDKSVRVCMYVRQENYTHTPKRMYVHAHARKQRNNEHAHIAVYTLK